MGTDLSSPSNYGGELLFWGVAIPSGRPWDLGDSEDRFEESLAVSEPGSGIAGQRWMLASRNACGQSLTWWSCSTRPTKKQHS